MNNRTKKSKGLVLAFYIIAGVFAAIAVFALVYSIRYLSSYATSYGMGISDLGLEAVQYVLSASCSYIGFAAVIFGIGKIISKLASCCECDIQQPQMCELPCSETAEAEAEPENAEELSELLPEEE